MAAVIVRYACASVDMHSQTFQKTNLDFFYNVYSMRWEENVARMGRRGMHIGYWWESQNVRDQWKDQDVGGWAILKWILERSGGMV
jgi:hypothetical protein